jgi:hypothetical protein
VDYVNTDDMRNIIEFAKQAIKVFNEAPDCEECGGTGEVTDYEWDGCYCMTQLEGGYCCCSPPEIECTVCKGTGKIITE